MNRRGIPFWNALPLAVIAVAMFGIAEQAVAWNPWSSAGTTVNRRFLWPPKQVKPPLHKPPAPAIPAVALPGYVQKTFHNGVAQRRQLSKDTVLYRYHSPKNAVPGQQGYVSLTDNPAYRRGAAEQMLSLPPGNTPTHVTTYVIPKGTVVDEGVVGPAFGRPGGGFQAVMPEVNPKWARSTVEIVR